MTRDEAIQKVADIINARGGTDLMDACAEIVDAIRPPKPMDNVIRFTGVTKLDMPPDMILQEAIEASLTRVVICGYVKDETEEYFASSIADGGTVVWLLERCKHILLTSTDEEE